MNVLNFRVKGGPLTAEYSEDGWGEEGDVEADSRVGQVLKQAAHHFIQLRVLYSIGTSNSQCCRLAPYRPGKGRTEFKQKITRNSSLKCNFIGEETLK